MFKKKIIFLMGPTCIGKSLIVLDLCKEFLMDFISVDASSIYKSMDIGTAKPGKKILCNVNYHLIDILEHLDRNRPFVTPVPFTLKLMGHP